MRKITKKLVALTLATATIASSIAATPSQNASAAAKKYDTYLVFANSKWTCVSMDDESNNVKNKAKTTVKNKKGTKNYTVTLKRAQAVNQDDKTKKATAAEDANVFCVDIKGILKDHAVKDIKMSNVVVKCDGKKVKFKMNKTAQGQLEKTSDPDKYRLEIYNVYGDGGTKNHPCAKPTKFKWKKSISVSFNLKIKK